MSNRQLNRLGPSRIIPAVPVRALRSTFTLPTEIDAAEWGIIHNHLEIIMGLKDLDDYQLREFVKDPTAFLKKSENFHKVFDLHDDKLRQRVEELRKEKKT